MYLLIHILRRVRGHLTCSILHCLKFNNIVFNFLGLKCFSCGSLLDPSRVCETFNPKDVTQVQTCGPNEGCLLYTWKKSSTETGNESIFKIIIFLFRSF